MSVNIKMSFKILHLKLKKKVKVKVSLTGQTDFDRSKSVCPTAPQKKSKIFLKVRLYIFGGGVGSFASHTHLLHAGEKEERGERKKREERERKEKKEKEEEEKIKVLVRKQIQGE